MKRVTALLVTLLIASTAQANDVDRSWDKAVVRVPDAFFSKEVTDLDKLDKKYPVVLYLHGCTGIYYPHDIGWAKLIADQGYIVILPDSYARQGRVAGCDTKQTRPTDAFPKRHLYRQQEIEYAMSKIQNSKWADTNNVFLMGHSEGGFATAKTTVTGFNGIIISGWTCTNGINSQPNVPGLAVAWTNDPWRVGTNMYGRCADYASNRKFTQVDLEGASHNTFGYRNAEEAVIKFLKDNSK